MGFNSGFKGLIYVTSITLTVHFTVLLTDKTHYHNAYYIISELL
jgi:hypothetical protein